MNSTTPHYGRRIAFLRGLYKMTQAQLGDEAGYKQQEISEFEGEAELNDDVLMRLLKPLGVTLDRFKEMDESAVGATVYHVHDQGQAFGPFNTNHFNPIDKILELVEENKKLYERLLDAEQEKVVFLQRQLDSSK